MMRLTTIIIVTLHLETRVSDDIYVLVFHILFVSF